MGQKFEITAQLNLREPKNLRSVASKIHKTIGGVNGNIDLKFSSQTNSRLDALNKRLTLVRSNLKGIPAEAANASAAINRLAGSFSKFSNVSQNVSVGVRNLNTHTVAGAKSTQKYASEMERFGAQAALAARRFLAFAGPVGILLGLVAAMKSGVQQAIEYQHINVRIGQVTGKTTSELKDLNREISNLAKGLGTSSHDLQDTALTLAQAGLSARNTKVALDALAKTTLAATFSSIQDTTEGAIAIMGQFGTSADKLEKQLSSVNTVSAKYAVESSDLITAVRKSGAVFKQAGGNLNELLGLFTAVRSTTRESADTIAAAFRTIFSRLQSPGRIKRLEDLLNIKLSDNGQFVGPIKAIKALSEALSGLPDGSLLKAAVAQEVAGIRQIGKFLPLVNNYALAIQAVGVAQDNETSLTKDSIRAQESLIVQLTKVKERFLDLFRTIEGSATFKVLAQSLISVANGLLAVSERLIPLLPAFAAFAAVKGGQALGKIGGAFVSRFGKGFSSGGLVPGSGSGDTVPARLTPGEVVFSKKAVNYYGKDNLLAMNSGRRGRSSGGVQFFADGGEVQPEIDVRDHSSRNAKRTAARRARANAKATKEKIEININLDTPKLSAEGQARLNAQLAGGYSLAPVQTYRPSAAPAISSQAGYGLAAVGTANAGSNIAGGPLPLGGTIAGNGYPIVQGPFPGRSTYGVRPVGYNTHQLAALTTPAFVPGPTPASYGLMAAMTASNRPAARGNTGLVSNFATGGAPNDYGVRPAFYSAEREAKSFEATVLAGLKPSPAGSIPLANGPLVESGDVRPVRRSRGLRSFLADYANNLGRPLNRAERIQTVQDFGRNDLLQTLGRRGRGQRLRGIAGAARNLLPTDLGRLVPTGLGALNSKAGRIGLAGLGALAFTGAGEHIAGKIGGETGKAGFGGFVEGATAGATLGSLGGPVGAAIGGVVGGIGGLVSSLDTLKRSLADKKAQSALEGIANAAEELSNAIGNGGKGSKEALGKLFASQTSSETEFRQAAAVKSQATPFEQAKIKALNVFRPFGNKTGDLSLFGLNLGNIHALQGEEEEKRKARENLEFSRLTKEGLGSSSDVETGILNERLRKSRSFLDFQSNTENQKLVGNRVQLRLSREIEVRGGHISDQGRANLQQHIAEEENKALRLQKAEFDKRTANLSAIDSFTRAIKTSSDELQTFSDRLADLEASTQKSQRTTSLLLGSTGSSPASIGNNSISTALSRFGSAGFEQSAGLLGRNGGALIGANRAHVALTNVLPHLLNGSLDVGTQEGFNQFRGGIEGALRGHGVGGSAQANILNQIDEFRNDPEFATSFGSGTANNKLRDTLLTWSKDIQEAEVEAAKQIESHTKDLSDRLGLLGQLGTEIIGQHNATDNAALSKTQFLQGRLDARGTGGEILSVAAQQHPFIANQARLTGLGNNSLNPNAILSSISQNRQGLVDAQRRVEANPLDTKAIAAVRGFEVQIQRSVQALKNLGDASNLNAAIQEKLFKLDADRQGRLGLGEQFFGASPAERQKLGENAGFAAKALQHGTLDKLSPEEQQKAVSFFQSARDIRLFGGKLTGGQHLNNLINNSGGGVFRQFAGDQAEGRGLEGAAAANHDRAIQANQGLAQVQEANRQALAQEIKQTADAFNVTIGQFTQNIDNFAKAAASIPHQITLTGSHRVEVVFNGAEMLGKLSPEMQKIAAEAAEAAVRKQLKNLGVGAASMAT